VDALLPLAYDELHTLADQFMRQERPDHTLPPTALINEAYLRLSKQKSVRWRNREHFLAIAAQAMRRVLVDHARAHKREKRGGERRSVPLEDTMLLTTGPTVDLLSLDAALDSLRAINSAHAAVVELRFFGGLSIADTAKVMGASTATVERHWRCARAWLFKALKNGHTNPAPEDADG